MTEAESIADSRDSYTEACRAQRMRLVARGDVFPRLAEPVDLMTLRAIGGAPEIMLTLKGLRYLSEHSLPRALGDV